jgi:hypothetical protein
MLPAASVEGEICRVCGKKYDAHVGGMCICPTCRKPFEAGHGCNDAALLKFFGIDTAEAGIDAAPIAAAQEGPARILAEPGSLLCFPGRIIARNPRESSER